MIGAVSEVDRFGGSAVCSAWESMWPFNRAKLTITDDWIDCERASGRRTVRTRSDASGSPVTVARYRYVPFLIRTVVWIDPATRDGFIPYRARAVRRSLESHRWDVAGETEWWLSWLPRWREKRAPREPTGEPNP